MRLNIGFLWGYAKSYVYTDKPETLRAPKNQHPSIYKYSNIEEKLDELFEYWHIFVFFYRFSYYILSINSVKKSIY